MATVLYPSPKIVIHITIAQDWKAISSYNSRNLHTERLLSVLDFRIAGLEAINALRAKHKVPLLKLDTKVSTNGAWLLYLYPYYTYTSRKQKNRSILISAIESTKHFILLPFFYIFRYGSNVAGIPVI
jgi:hypothetical protein